MSKFSDISKEVGWDHKTVYWPTVRQVEASNDLYQVLTWNRFLPSPISNEQRSVIEAVVKRLSELREEAADA